MHHSRSWQQGGFSGRLLGIRLDGWTIVYCLIVIYVIKQVPEPNQKELVLEL